VAYLTDFRAVGYPLRLHSGRDALAALPDEVKRRNARRAFVICGRTVASRTDLIARIRQLLGDSCAGTFDAMGKDSPLPAITAAVDATRAAQADLLIAVGGGSVIQAVRVVAILLAERRPIEELITQYPENGPAVSPKLLDPKLPIINVLTLPTSAQNRGGSAVKAPQLDHRMEFFDPKTRPVAIFWDAAALLTASPPLARSAGVSVFWRAVMNLGAPRMNPLVEGDRLQALRLARDALRRCTDPADADARIALCAAALLQNREADDGGTMFEPHWVGRVTYAFVTALLMNFPHVGQGEASTALTATVMRRLGTRDADAMRCIARALGLREADAPNRIADYLERCFTDLGMPLKVRELGVPHERLSRVVEHSLKNFNADPRREFVRERPLLHDLIEAAW
jgi:alcohol dehydrogenase class IV